MSDNLIRSAIVAGLAAAALIASGCSTTDHQPMADAVALNESWASAAEAGMTAVFGTFTNTAPHSAHIVSGHSTAADRVEIHEVVPDGGGTMTMQQKSGGLTIPSGGSHDLAPGGDHLMLMELREPLLPGAEVALTVVFEDGSELPVTAQVRDFAGGNEDYRPDMHDHG